MAEDASLIGPPQPQPKVLIVGAGSTGMTAALELSRLGIAVRIVERSLEPATTSRALAVQARTLELFAQRGLIEPMLAKGNRGQGGSIYGDGKLLFRLDFSLNGSDYNYILLISQAETEAILRAALEQRQVPIERGVELIALSQADHRADHAHMVTAILRHADGRLEEVHPDYLIDAEGAHSIARTTLNLQFAGKTRAETYVLGDLYADGDLPSTDIHIFSSEHGFMGMFPMGGGRFRLIASNPLTEPAQGSAPTLDEIQAIYNQRAHIPARFHDMSWSSWFRINSRMVDHMRVNRVFFGGDSAHIHSPAGGQGMNTGIQDMINLCWKLAFVLHSQADPRLLDTYNGDRRPVIRTLLTQTEGLTDVIGTENHLFRSVFAYIAPWLTEHEFVQETATAHMSQLALNYRDSWLSVSLPVSGGLHAGDRVPNLKVHVDRGQNDHTSEESLFPLLRTDALTLLCANQQDTETVRSAEITLAPWKPVMQTHIVNNPAPVTADEDPTRAAFGSEPSLVLVRPDGYVAFRAPASDVDSLVQYLTKWFPISAS